MAKLFLSHASGDKEFVRQLASDLKSLGHEPWLDEWEIRVGESITARIEHGIGEADFVIIVLSEKASKSNWVEKEWQAKYWDEVQQNRVRLLPIVFEDCQIPKLLQDKKYADFRHNYAVGLVGLNDSINTLVALKDPEPKPILRSPMPLSEILQETLEDLEERPSSPILGVATGFIDFDRFTLGLRSGRLYSLVSNPGAGITSLGLNIAQHASIREQIGTVFFSPESSRSDNAARILCSEAEISIVRFHANRLSQNEWVRIIQTTRGITEAPLFVDDSPNPDLGHIEDKVALLQLVWVA